jgi:hypothetical protein
LHDLAEEICELKQNRRLRVSDALGICSQLGQSTINEELNALAELFHVVLDIVEMLVLHQVSKLLCLDVQLVK